MAARKQAALGVATMPTSATEIVDVAFITLPLHRAFAREGEDVVVACSCQDNVMLVACLFW